MTKNLHDNKLLWALVLAHILYASVGLATERPFVYRVVAIMAAIAGFYGVVVYSRKAWEIVWLKRRTEEGGHLKILGVWFLAWAALYAGIWRGVFLSFNEPPAWTQTWHSSYTLVAVMIGMFFVTISPAAMENGTPMPRAYWIVGGGAVIFVIGVMLGAYLS